MEGIFLFILMGFGASLVWKRLTGKSSGASSQEEAGGVLFFLLFAGAILFMFLMWLLAQMFPTLKHDKVLAVAVMLIIGYFYLQGLFRFGDWVVGKKSNEDHH